MKKRRKVNNNRNGKSFEQKCVARAIKIASDLVVKWVKKDRFVSAHDIEFIDFPEMMVDCKFTISDFNWSDKKRLYRQTKLKYNGLTVVILGERKGKQSFSWPNIS